MEKCPYFSQCNYSNTRACKTNYPSCTIYQRKEMLERIKVERVSIYFDEPKALESKLA